MKLREAGISWRRTGDEIVVLDLQGSEYFALNASGALLWEQLATVPRSHHELEELLQSAYGLAAPQAVADVRTFLATLATHQLVEE